MHRFYAPGAAGSATDLPADEAHHLLRVLRLTTGDAVIVFDGAGREWAGRVAQVTKHGATVALLEPRQPAAEPAVEVTLAVGLLKGAQMDQVVRDATALGAAAIQPFVSAHVAVAEAARRARSEERWRRVAVASAKQCARAVVPVVRPICAFTDLMATFSASVKIVCVEPGRAVRGTIAALPAPARALVCVGPEGGWSAEELTLAAASRCEALDLGPRTLRAEVAPVVALAALWTQWGWTGAGSRPAV